MPCRPVAEHNGKYGSGQAGGGGYTTEADCLQACKEGACCEGTTCTVKPQCQCKCTSGVCCGPDIATIDGISGPRCREQVTESQCQQLGGSWICGGSCMGDKTGSLARCVTMNSQAPVFKGVGTTCTPNPCGCCGNGEVFGAGSVSVSVTRTLDVVASSSCSCVPGQNPPSIATQCRNQSSSFSQYGTQQSCQRTVQGTTEDYGNVLGTVGFLQSPCKVYCLLAWPLNPCGLLSQTYFAWDFVSGQTSYSASYFVFLFVDGRGGSVSVSSLTSSVPATPTHPQAGRSYAYGGAMWSVTLGVSFA
jgi:hypothetical protein